MAEPVTAVSMMHSEVPSEDGVLVDHLQRVQPNPKGAYAVHMHLSRLRAEYRKRHFLRIASRAFDPLINNHEVMLYLLSNSDFVLMCRNVPIDELDPPINRVRTLFGEDPLTFAEVGSPDDRFTNWYDLSQPGDFDTCEAAVGEIMEADQELRRRSTSRGADGRMQTQQGDALTPENLGDINDRLKNARVTDLLRRQVAISLDAEGKGVPLFREHYISMTDLRDRIAPGVNLFSNPWMFQYLTETLDRRVLAVMARRDFPSMTPPASLNLNVATVLSPGFQTFHQAVGAHTDKVVVEMQPIDVFASMSAYVDARAWLKNRGYGVLIDGLNPLSLSFFDPGLLEPDFIKLTWSPEFHSGIPADRLADIKDVLGHLGIQRAILARVDSEAAVRWGLGLGIQRFQGHFIDRLVSAMATKGEN